MIQLKNKVKNMYMEENLDLPLKNILEIMQRRILRHTSYFGVKTLKNPLDSWIYQEIVFDTRPDVIIEIGNAHGGGTLALAHLCDLVGHGRVIGIDLTHKSVPDIVKNNPLITFIDGDACKCFNQVYGLIDEDDKVMIIEDSSHTYNNTIEVLRTYCCLIRPGDYFIVEDSIVNHGVTINSDPGPYKAIEDFIKENPLFEIDREKESFFITWNPKGFLKRK